ncbi:MAG: hypothetical protein AAFP00_16670, partial [Bacteroidota bacterium]
MESEWASYDQARNNLLYGLGLSDPVLAEMIRKNVIVPFEMNQTKDGTIVGGSKVKYELVTFPSGNHILPSEYYVADVSVPGSFSWRKTHAVTFDAYDHILTAQEENAQKMSYGWYTSQPMVSSQTSALPLWKAINTSNERVAYTSFEPTLDGQISSDGWDISGDPHIERTTVSMASGIQEMQNINLYSYDGSDVDVNIRIVSSSGSCFDNGSLLRVKKASETGYMDYAVSNVGTLQLSPGNYTFQLICGCNSQACANGTGNGFSSPDISIEVDCDNKSLLFEGLNNLESSKTGEKVLKLYKSGSGQQNTISSKALPSGTYKLSFWHKGSPIKIATNGTTVHSHVG